MAALINPSYGIAQDGTIMTKVECPNGLSTAAYRDWHMVAENAIRTANNYADRQGSEASYDQAFVDLVQLQGGDYDGEFRAVMIDAKAKAGPSFAILTVNFDVCAAPSELDPDDGELFSVLFAKLDGVPF